MGSNRIRAINNLWKMKDQAKEFLEKAEAHLNNAKEILKEIK